MFQVHSFIFGLNRDKIMSKNRFDNENFGNCNRQCNVIIERWEIQACMNEMKGRIIWYIKFQLAHKHYLQYILIYI